MRNEQARQNNWTQKSSNMRAQIAIQTGNNVANNLKQQQISSVFQGVSNMYTAGMFTPEKEPVYTPTNPAVTNRPIAGSMSYVPQTNWSFGK